MSKETKLLFVLFILGSCKEPNIIGYWKIEPSTFSKYIDSTLIKNNEFGDLILSSDSTFLIKGFGSNNSTTPGWHVGGDV